MVFEMEAGGCTAEVLWIFSRQHTAFLCNSHLAFPLCILSMSVVHPYSCMDTATAWKKSFFILLYRLDFHMIDSLSVAVHAFAKHMLMSFSVDVMLLPRYMNWSTNFRDLPLRVVMPPFCLKHMYSVLLAFT